MGAAAAARLRLPRPRRPAPRRLNRAAVTAAELAHALGVHYEEHGRARAETIVDAVTYLVCSSAGLDVSCESVSYLASRGGKDAVETVRETAELIDRIARRIEQAIAPQDEPVPA